MKYLLLLLWFPAQGQDTTTIETSSKRIRIGVYDIYVRIKLPAKSCVYGNPPLTNNAWLHHAKTRVYAEGIDEVSEIIIGEKKRIKKVIHGTEQKRVINKYRMFRHMAWVKNPRISRDTTYKTVPAEYLWADNAYYGGLTIKKRIKIKLKGMTYLPIGIEYQVDDKPVTTKYMTLNFAQ